MQENEKAATARIGKGMIYAMWLVVLGLLMLIFDGFIEQQRNPNRNIETMQLGSGAKEVVLERNRAGHYVVDGRVNGQPVVFLLDTGATDVSIPGSLASRLGLKRGMAVDYRTANGVITGYLTRLDRVAIGDIELRDVRGSINPNVGDDEILLGMSFLRHLEFTQRGDTLILRQY